MFKIPFKIILFISHWCRIFFLFGNRIKGFLSVDIDISELQVNQCSSPRLKETNQIQPLSANKYYDDIFRQIEIFHDSNKCHPFSMLVCIKSEINFQPPSFHTSVCFQGKKPLFFFFLFNSIKNHCFMLFVNEISV